MAKALKLKFATEAGKSVSMNIANVSDKITADQVKALGADIVSKKVFTSNGSDLTKLTAAHVVETDSTDLLAQ